MNDLDGEYGEQQATPSPESDNEEDSNESDSDDEDTDEDTDPDGSDGGDPGTEEEFHGNRLLSSRSTTASPNPAQTPARSGPTNSARVDLTNIDDDDDDEKDGERPDSDEVRLTQRLRAAQFVFENRIANAIRQQSSLGESPMFVTPGPLEIEDEEEVTVSRSASAAAAERVVIDLTLDDGEGTGLEMAKPKSEGNDDDDDVVEVSPPTTTATIHDLDAQSDPGCRPLKRSRSPTGGESPWNKRAKSE